ncbi:MAG: hypothetical protein WBD51_22470, partial [Burkholderiaceae bacterium]
PWTRRVNLLFPRQKSNRLGYRKMARFWAAMCGIAWYWTMSEQSLNLCAVPLGSRYTKRP